MSFGINIVTSSGKVIQMSSIPVTIKDVIPVAPDASGSKAYPELLEMGVQMAVSVQRNGNTVNANLSASVSYPGGVPTVSWGPSGTGNAPGGGIIVVFVV